MLFYRSLTTAIYNSAFMYFNNVLHVVAPSWNFTGFQTSFFVFMSDTVCGRHEKDGYHHWELVLCMLLEDKWWF